MRYYLQIYFRWLFLFYHTIFNYRLIRFAQHPDFYKSKEFAVVRFMALEREGYYCHPCGRRPPEVVLNVEHVLPIKYFPWLCLSPWNLSVACRFCNWGKGNRIVRDYRR